MNKRNAILLVILIVLLCCVGAFVIGARLNTHTHVATARASDLPDVFSSVRNILLSGTAPQQFAAAPDTAENCVLIDISIELENKGFFDAEWVSATLVPGAGDIAVYSLTGEGATVPAHGTGTFNLKLISKSGNVQGRVVQLEYYVLGRENQITIAL